MPQSRKRRTAGRSHTRTASPQRQQARASAARRTRIIAAVIIFALVAAGAAYLFAPAALRGGGSAGAEVTTASGLKYTDLVVGTGPSPRVGQTVVVHYTGTLTNGTKFDSSLDRGQPYKFVLGGQVIEGWNEGVATMKVGGKRHLVIPPALGYGPAGQPPKIPGGATLLFDIELLDVK